MTDFFEIDETKKSIKNLILDDFSIEDLNKYVEELKVEIDRVTKEIERKKSSKKSAENFFR